jgi:CubicO group peptidase (beta-lactamase class C family)
LVLALMALPTVIIATRSSLKAVPPSIREAALGVGASRSQAVFHHVLPLAMPDTTFFPNPAQKARVAALYTDRGTTLERAAVVEKSTLEAKIPTPQGGLFSTAEDMFHFNQMVLNKGSLNGKRVLSAAAVELMATSLTGDMKTGFAPGVGHGFGYEVVRNGAATVRYNSVGSVVKGGAYRTYEFVDFQKDLVGVLMMQRTNGNGDVSDEINAFLGMAAGAIEK